MNIIEKLAVYEVTPGTRPEKDGVMVTFTYNDSPYDLYLTREQGFAMLTQLSHVLIMGKELTP